MVLPMLIVTMMVGVVRFVTGRNFPIGIKRLLLVMVWFRMIKIQHRHPWSPLLGLHAEAITLPVVGCLLKKDKTHTSQKSNAFFAGNSARHSY